MQVGGALSDAHNIVSGALGAMQLGGVISDAYNIVSGALNAMQGWVVPYSMHIISYLVHQVQCRWVVPYPFHIMQYMGNVLSPLHLMQWRLMVMGLNLYKKTCISENKKKRKMKPEVQNFNF